jgi:DNA-binding MarR family transcriptional regulator
MTPQDASLTPDAAALDLSPLEQLVGFNIHILDLVMYQRFYENFAGRSITPGTFSALLAIKLNPGIRHGALADALMIQRPNMTKLINRLERAGYVRRRAARDDQRSVVLRLSEKGAQAVAEMRAAITAHEDKLASGLSARERETLLRLLRKLIAQLGAPAQAGGGGFTRA